MNSSKPLEIAIIGGGLIGMHLAIGLLSRPNVSATLYEQGETWRGQGSGMAFTASAMEIMRELDPRILDALQKVASPPSTAVYLTNQHPACIDRRQRTGEPSYDFAIGNPKHDVVLRALPRDQFIHELQKLLPINKIKFGLKLQAIEKRQDGRCLLTFENGTTAEADAVIGCDGIKSKTRRITIGGDNPAAYPQDTHQREYRSHIPFERAKEILHDVTGDLTINMGPGGYVITYPFSNPDGKFMGVGAVIQDQLDWGHPSLKLSASKDAIVQHFSTWEPRIRKLIEALPDVVDLWVIFDMTKHALESYAFGPVCLAGDAAHASTPFLGIGACMGIEDAFALVTALDLAATKLQSSNNSSTTETVVTDAFLAYDTVRRVSSQSGSKRSGEAIETYSWRNPDIGNDTTKMGHDLQNRWYAAWSFDYKKMKVDLIHDFEKRSRV